MRDIATARPRLTRRDFVLALVLGAGAFFFVKAASPALLDPAQWGETAVAAGLRPPKFVFPGLWRLAAKGIFSALGINGALKVLSWAGPAAAGACTALLYAIVKMMLLFLTRHASRRVVWQSRIVPFFAAAAAVLAALSSPVQAVWQNFSPEGLRFLMLLSVAYLFLRWLSCGGRWRLWVFTALTGILAAETPFAFILPVVMVLVYRRVWYLSANELYLAPETLSDPDELPKWRILFLFLASLAFIVWVNVETFKAMGGLAANGWSLQDAYFRYASGYARMTTWASNVTGWILGLGFCIFPALLALMLLPSAMRDDRPMLFTTGAILIFLAFIALLQSGALPDTRFWILMNSFAPVRSGFLLAVYAAATAFTLAAAGAAFAFECQMAYLPDDAPRPGWGLAFLVPGIALLLLPAVAWGTNRATERKIALIVADAIDETIRECGNAKWLFTDDCLGEAVSLFAAAQHKPLRTIDLISGPSAYDQYVRTAPFPEKSADRDLAAIGNSALFRVWAGEKEHGMDEAAIQTGFDFYRRARKPIPRASGFVARSAGMTAEEAQSGIERTRKLANRILEAAPQVEAASASPSLVAAFQAAQWRISRLARLRQEYELADRLDSYNYALKRVMGLIDEERRRTFQQLTPREGLMFALHRADFNEAMRYAPGVLANAPYDPDANFGMGMGYLLEDDLENAELYLKRVLDKVPGDPAVLNNLSILARRKKRFDEAEALARRALEILPDSPEVKKTLQDALDRK